MITARQEKILIAIIKEYIKKAEPVGSTVIMRKYDFNFSSATIRNEMKMLEESGYICKSHTSSGRIPMKKAYKVYIKKLVENKISLPAFADKIRQEFYHSKDELENIIKHANKILSGLTHYTSLVLVPNLSSNVIKYLKLIKLSSNSIMLVMVNGIGILENKIINFTHSVDEYDLERLTDMLNQRLNLSSNLFFREDILKNFSHLEYIENLLSSIEKIINDFKSACSNKVFCEGISNLLEIPNIEDIGKLKFLFELLKEEKLIAQVMAKTINNEGINIYIGNEFLPLDADFSLITATYNVKNTPAGTMGILGPIRMPYEKIISILNFTAYKFGQKLERLI